MSSKAVVRINEMEPEMAEEAFIAAMDALEQQYNESDIANQVKERFEEKYGGLWHCFVGRNFGAFVTHEEKKNHLLLHTANWIFAVWNGIRRFHYSIFFLMAMKIVRRKLIVNS